MVQTVQLKSQNDHLLKQKSKVTKGKRTRCPSAWAVLAAGKWVSRLS